MDCLLIHGSRESSCLRVQLKVGGRSHLRLNMCKRPIAYKYREGKMKQHPGEGSEKFLKPLGLKHLRVLSHSSSVSWGSVSLVPIF